MAHRARPLVKAFLVCENIRGYSDKGQADLFGAGLWLLRSASHPPFPCKLTFWVYMLLVDAKPQARVELAIMRADSGRRYSFREIDMYHTDRLRPGQLVVHVFNFEFPQRGEYYVELWYDGRWLIDYRLQFEA
jgi:hypothetical protein